MTARLGLAILLVYALATGVDLVLTPLPARSTVIDVLVEASRTGADVSAAVAARGISERAWGRAMFLYDRGRALTDEVTARLCKGTRR